MPSMSDWGLGSSSHATQQVTVTVESDPPGADAKASSGGGCRTPCALAVQASGNFTVDVSLNGYIAQSVPVTLIPPEDPRFASEGAPQGPRVDPNPIFVELEKAPPPAPVKKHPVKKKKPATARAPAPQSTAAAPPASAEPAAAAAEPASASTAPWPMPR